MAEICGVQLEEEEGLDLFHSPRSAGAGAGAGAGADQQYDTAITQFSWRVRMSETI